MKRELVAALIIKESKILLVHNIKHGLRIEPPGGKIEIGETSENAIKRELNEELDIDVVPISHFGDYNTASDEGEFSVKMYICEIIKGEPQIPESEQDKIKEFRWYSFDEIDELARKGILAPNLQEALPKLRKLFKLSLYPN